MEAKRPLWREEAWVPLVAGLAWIASASGSGWLAYALAVLPGSVLVASGVAGLLWPGDARPRHFGALASLAGVLLGLVSFAWAGFLGGLALIALSTASGLACGALALRRLGTFEEVPPPAPGLRIAAETCLDSAILGQMTLSAPAHALRGDGRRVVEEVREALELFRARGWVEKPTDYHVTPPPLEKVELSRARSRGVEFEHLRFESGYEPHADEPGRHRWLSYAPCRVAHAWVLRHAGADRPWLICTHGYQMGVPWIDFGAFRPSWLHYRLGLNLVLPVLPMHGPRKIRRVSGDGFLSGDLVDTVHALAQTAWDLRRILSWIRSQGGERVGAYGLSLGGYSTALLACFADDLACAIPGIPATDFARLSWRHGPPDDLRRAEELGVGIGETTDLKKVISPLALQPRVPRERRYIFGGSADLLVPPDQVRDLWQHWGRPKMLWYPGAHVTFPLHASVRRFLEGAFRESGLAL